MSVFVGGSAMSMVRDVAEGYIIVSEHTFKKFQVADLQGFAAELEKFTREIRGSAAPPNDIDAVQKRNRKLQRLYQVQQILNSVLTRRRRG